MPLIACFTLYSFTVRCCDYCWLEMENVSESLSVLLSSRCPIYEADSQAMAQFGSIGRWIAQHRTTHSF